ncbi:MAG TPA: hypothetical protein VN285_11085 [Candidatus Deferrimicrobium sp.]|nr:hypothetical protein [Candidatus Deferrimicrobium sp.]
MNQKPLVFALLFLFVFSFGVGLTLSSATQAGPDPCCYKYCPGCVPGWGVTTKDWETGEYYCDTYYDTLHPICGAARQCQCN